MSHRFHEKPLPPKKLQSLTYLRHRTNLSLEAKEAHKNLEKGYVGELRFYDFLKSKLPSNQILVNSLRLKSNNSEFQLDSLLLNQNKLYLFEVKNFEGDFYINGNNWYVDPSGKEITNPLIQLKRSQSLMRQLLLQNGFNLAVESYIVFINPEFALFQAPIHLPIILSAQLNRFFDQLFTNPFKPTKTQNKLRDLLISKHIENSIHDQLPEYHYDQLKKGIRCNSCSGFLSRWNKNYLICRHCSSKELIESAVMRNVNEFNLLFPQSIITTNIIHDWCAVIPSKLTIRSILSKHLTTVGAGRSTHYIFTKKSN